MIDVPDPKRDEEHRIPLRSMTVNVAVVLTLLVIAVSSDATWLIGTIVRPSDTPTAIPPSEALKIAIASGLIGYLGGQMTERAREKDASKESEQ